MVTFAADTCHKCRRNSPVDFSVEPEEVLGDSRVGGPGATLSSST
jgi:hypothetical protein